MEVCRKYEFDKQSSQTKEWFSKNFIKCWFCLDKLENCTSISTHNKLIQLFLRLC